MSESLLVMFDLDGTIVDSQDQIVAAMEQAFVVCALPFPGRAETLSIVGLSLPQAMRQLLPTLTAEECVALEASYRDAFQKLRETEPLEAAGTLYPGAREALERIGSWPSVKLGVATGKAMRGVRHLYAVHDLEGYFLTTQTSDFHPSKPDPAMLQAALQESGCVARRAVMIGDTEYDIRMGRSAGCRTIGVSWGYHSTERLRKAGADTVIDDFDQLDAALENLSLAGGKL